MNKRMNLAMQWVGSVTGPLRDFVSRSRLRGLSALFVAFLLLSASGCAWLDAKQREIIYRPTLGVPTDFVGLRTGDERYFVNVPQTVGTLAGDANKPAPAEQRIDMWWLPHADENAPTLLYFHGTFRNLFQNQYKIQALRDAGFAVLAVEYRGWGVSTPITPSEQTILQDADLAWVELQRREPRAAQRVIYGHSMGSAVAVDVASRLRGGTDYGALILEAALTSFDDVASEAGFIARLLSNLNRERFASIEKIIKIKVPLLMIHGSADTTVPMRLGEKLFAAANPVKWWLPIDGGGHSDLHEVGRVQYQATVQRFKNTYVSADRSIK
jgi:uncharacterized protein